MEPSDQTPRSDKPQKADCPTTTCSPFSYGVGAFFVAPVAAIFCILMGAMMILAWPFIPFLCYMQKKEEISKANSHAARPTKLTDAACCKKAN
jgi:hypothetical protein